MIKQGIAVLLFVAPVAALAADPAVMHRDPGCGCCEKWAAQVSRHLKRPVRVVDDPSRAAFQRRHGVPTDAGSCHTAIVDGLVVEGHVPPSDITRALARRSPTLRGLAVAGMPPGSPGMETPNRLGEPFDTIAFGSSGVRVFARHRSG